MAGPKSPQTQHIEHSNLTVGNTNLDGTGTIVAVWTGVAGDSLCEMIVVKAKQDVTGGMIRFYRDNGTLKIPIGEIYVPPTSTSLAARVAPTWVGTFSPGVDGRCTSTSDKIYAAPHNSETFGVTAIGANY